MAVVISNEQFQTKSYVSQYEMMQDNATMSNNSYVIVYVLPATYVVKYKKAL